MVKQESYLAVDELDVLLNLVDLELIKVVSHVGVVLLLLIAFQSLSAIEEIVPVEVLVIFGEIVIESDGLRFRYAQLVAHHID